MFNTKISIKILSVFFSISILLSLFGCNKSETSQKNDYPVTISDVTIKKSPEKIVVLSDSLADIVLAMGLEAKLAARTDECTQEDLSTIPSIGNAKNINLDNILSCSPDLVLTDKVLNNDISAGLSDADIPVILLSPATDRESFMSLYSKLGSALKGAETGKKLGEKTSNDILMTLDDINRIIPQKDVAPTACYFYDSTKKIATGDTFASNLIELAGAINVAKGLSDKEMDTNAIKLSNPNYIFCAKSAKTGLLSDGIISALSASKEGKIYEMEDALMLRQGKTVVDAAAFMASMMYPEIAISPSSSNNNSSSSSSSSDTGSSQDSSSSKDDSNSSTLDIKEGMFIPYGETSENVLKLELRLDELDFMPTKPNNEFDEYTIRAITDFQYVNGLETTGEADEKTLRLLFSGNAIPRGEPSRDK